MRTTLIRFWYCRDDRPQTQTVNRGSRPRQRSPIDYDDMDRIPQGGATSSFGERRNITLRNSVPDIGPSPEIGFSLINEVTRSFFLILFYSYLFMIKILV